jgi:ketosteroid isomerase-like protein
MKIGRVGVVTAVVMLAFGCTQEVQIGPGSPAATQAEVESAVREFLSAFEMLDWQRFTAAFDSSATVFFPVPEPPSRFTGRSEFEPQFQKVFTGIRASNPAGPPYHQLKPEGLSIEVLADDVALVTFHLRNEERTGRRTLVLVRAGDKWLIHHLHASNVPRD